MFQNLKSKNNKGSTYKNLPTGPYPDGLHNFHSNPKSSTDASQSTAPYKGNEKDRLVRCRTCGFPCDKERDAMSKDNTWAGLGITQGVQLTAGTSIGDKRVPAAGSVAKSPDKYYNRSVVSGCPSCGDLLYYM